MSETREPTEGADRSHTEPAPISQTATGTGAVSHGSPTLSYGLAESASPLLRLGGALGIAASCIGLLVFVAACAGLNKTVVLSIIPVGLSLPGLVLTIVGAIKDKPLITEDTHVLQALFANIAGLIGGLLEMTVWLNWRIFYH